MKKALFVISAVVVLLASSAAFAQEAGDVTVDAILGVGTEPESGFGSAFGFGIGTSADFEKFILVDQSSAFSNYSKNIRFRVDLSYFKWDKDVSGQDISYRRIPLFVGGRYHFHSGRVKVTELSLYGEAGIETSFDKEEAVVTVGGTPIKESKSKLRTGLAVGAGIQYPIAGIVRIGAGARQHLVADSYLTVYATVGFDL